MCPWTRLFEGLYNIALQPTSGVRIISGAQSDTVARSQRSRAVTLYRCHRSIVRVAAPLAAEREPLCR